MTETRIISNNINTFLSMNKTSSLITKEKCIAVLKVTGSFTGLTQTARI